MHNTVVKRLPVLLVDIILHSPAVYPVDCLHKSVRLFLLFFSSFSFSFVKVFYSLTAMFIAYVRLSRLLIIFWVRVALSLQLHCSPLLF